MLAQSYQKLSSLCLKITFLLLAVDVQIYRGYATETRNVKLLGEAKGEKSGKEFSSKTTKTVTKSGSSTESSKVSITGFRLSALGYLSPGV